MSYIICENYRPINETHYLYRRAQLKISEFISQNPSKFICSNITINHEWATNSDLIKETLKLVIEIDIENKPVEVTVSWEDERCATCDYDYDDDYPAFDCGSSLQPCAVYMRDRWYICK